MTVFVGHPVVTNRDAHAISPATMNQPRELQQLIGHRAELIERMKDRLNSVEADLRLTCVDDEIRKAKADSNASVFAKTRSAMGRILKLS
jgi:hypothetical protein